MHVVCPPVRGSTSQLRQSPCRTTRTGPKLPNDFAPRVRVPVSIISVRAAGSLIGGMPDEQGHLGYQVIPVRASPATNLRHVPASRHVACPSSLQTGTNG